MVVPTQLHGEETVPGILQIGLACFTQLARPGVFDTQATATRRV